MKKGLKTKILISVGSCLLVGFLGSVATQTSITTWYITIEKPTWNPPNWLFGPVWTLLFIFMGIAAALVWNSDMNQKQVQKALTVFGVQLILNALWSVVFFGLQSPLWAFIEIVFLFIMILLTIYLFKPIHKTAAYLLIPYSIWVAFAALLTFEIARLN